MKERSPSDGLLNLAAGRGSCAARREEIFEVLKSDVETGRLWCGERGTVFADGGYEYSFRHLGIGGKHGSPTVNPKDMTPYCPEKRFAAYRESMALYKRLKPYFSRGVFHGLGEHAHLHTLPDRAGGVLLMFNITGEGRTMEARIDADVIRAGSNPRVLGADSSTANGILHLRADVPGMSAAVIRIGDAARDIRGVGAESEETGNA